MAVWPASLPHAPLLDDLEIEDVDQAISTDMESGPPKRRRRFSTAFGFRGMSFLLTGTQLATLDAFYAIDLEGGSGTITGFPDPKDGSAATFQPRGSYTPRIFRPGPPHLRRWRVRLVWDRVA
jgi:hypothetical protein